MQHLAGRVAVITGAAGELGRALAAGAASLGMRLVLADVDAAALARVAGTLQAGGAEVLAMVCDVSRAAHVEELADAAMIRFHAVHLLFNAAHASVEGCVWDHTAADWERVLGTTLWGALHTVRVFTPLMLACAARDPDYEGHIVFTETMAGPAGAVGVAGRAVAVLAETLRADLRRVGAPIAVSVLCAQSAKEDVARLAFAAIRRGDSE
jgi:NAD(P)-dependent dehydrogenase (short-subunit alcohol dehydrogenase family)